MAFGTGVLISALSFELVQPAFRQGGLAATSLGFAAGGFIGAFALSTLEA